MKEAPHKTLFWKELNNNRIQCSLCPRYCSLSEGQRGFCFVRQNIDGEMVLTTYGKSSGFCIDPVEKKPLNHFYPGTGVFSFGTAGCNLGCKFCQNWRMSKSKQFDSLTAKASPRQIAQTAQQRGCKSVAFTYNDPIIFVEYAMDTADACHKLGIKTIAVTAGYINANSRSDFFGCMDAVNVDLKAFTEDFYRKISLGSLQPVLDTLFYLRYKTQIWFEITTLLIPGLNDSDSELQSMTEWIHQELGDSIPLHFTAFHPDFRMRNYPSTPRDTLTRARQIAMDNGLRYVYTGNIHDSKGSSTYCYQCGQILIERNWYTLGAYTLKNQNQCSNCGTVCSGCFEDSSGN